MSLKDKYIKLYWFRDQEESPKSIEKPCYHAEFKLRRACCEDRWICRNEKAEKTFKMPVTGKYCKEKCAKEDEIRTEKR